MDSTSELMLYAWISNITFFCGIYYIYKIKNNLMDYSIIFLVFLFLFCNGQVFLYSLGTKIDDLLIFKICTINEILDAEKYFCFSIQMFIVGEIALIKGENIKINEISYKISTIYMESMELVGIIMICISIIPFLLVLFNNLRVSIHLGYAALYSANDNASLFSGMLYITKMFIPGIIMIMYVKRENRIILRLLIIIICLIALLFIISGNRGEGLSLVVMLIIFYNTFIKKYYKKNMLIIAILVVFILLSIPVFASFRLLQNRSFSDFTSVITEVLCSDTNPIVSAISELGYTMHPWILTQRIVPLSKNYAYGESYIASVLMLIPRIFLGGHSFASKAALDIWLQSTLNMPYGPGYSLFAETYYNFGWYFGILASFVLGAFFSKMFNVTSKNREHAIIKRLLALIFLYNSLILARFPFHSTVRNLVYLGVIPYLGILILANKDSYFNIKGSVKSFMKNENEP